MAMNDFTNQTYARKNPLAGSKGSELRRARSSLNNSIFSIALCIAVLPQMTSAQEAPESVKNVAKQIPTDKTAIEAHAEFLARNVPATPLPLSSRLDTLRARAAQLQKQHADYLDKVAAGEAAPFPEIAEARPQHEKEVAALAQSLADLSAEDDADKRELASRALFAALQPLGPMLQDADYVEDYENVITPDQLAEYQRLETAWEAAAVNHAPGTQPLSTVSPGQLYTLTHLRVPLVVKARPNSTVLFRAQAGGLFSNKLPIIEKTTDENGIATAIWSTQGDAIANCPIDLLSPDAPTDGASFNITTVKLVLAPLPGVAVPGL